MSEIAFKYRAVNPTTGDASRGAIEAHDERDAYRKIRALGLTPLKLTQVASGAASSESEGSGALAKLFTRRIATSTEVSTFTYQLSVLIEAGIPLSDCLLSIAEHESNARFRAVLLDIARMIQSGRGVSEALAQHERVFGLVYIETLRAAETSGNMVAVLQHLAQAVEEQSEMRRTLRAALTYPVVVLITLLIATTYLVTFVVPKFATMFRERGIDLPPLTLGLMAVGNSVQSYWYLYLFAIVAGVWTLKAYASSPAGAERLDALLHKVPGLREILVAAGIARFSGVLGVTVRSGIPLTEAIVSAGRACGRPTLRADSQEIASAIRSGQGLSDAIDATKYLTPFARQLLRAGEQSASLSRMCDILATQYQREAQHRAKAASTLVEPIMIAGLTGIVLVVALAIFLPMWDMVSVVGG